MINYIRFFILVSFFIPGALRALSLPDTHEAVHLSVRTTSQDEKLSLDLQLYEALKAGSVEDVERLLAHGASPGHQSSLRVAPLFYAAYYGNVECVTSLLDFGADWEVMYARWLTPHHIAFFEGHTKVAQLLAARGSVLKDTNAYGWTPLHRAAFFGDDERVLTLIPQGFSVNGVSGRGETPLHLAAKGGSISCVNHLLEMKADSMVRQQDGSTVLHCAAEGGLLPLIGLCLEKGFNLHEADERGWQPIHCASRYGSSEAVTCLLINGADGNAQTLDGLRPVHLAATHADVHSLRALVEQGAELFVASGRGRTPLHHAASSNSVACAQFCLANDVHTEAQDNQGWRAFDIAADRGSLEVLTTLLKHGVELKQAPLSFLNRRVMQQMRGLLREPKELSPLRLAVDGGHAECVGALLDAGAASFSELTRADTPLDAALTCGSHAVLEAFVQRICRLHHPSKQETKESCQRIAEFFNVISVYRERYSSLAKMGMYPQLAIITSLDETEEDLARAILDRLIKSEHVPHLGSEKGNDFFESVSKDDLPHLLTIITTREAVKRYFCKVLQKLFKRFLRKDTELRRLNDPQYQLMSEERRMLLDPMQVEENFGSTIRRGINEWMTFLEDPIKTSKGHMRTRYGYTPLHFAAMRSSADIVRSLLEQGLSVSVRTDTDDDVTPLHLAALGGKLENMILIHKAGIPMTATTKRGTTVLQCAAYGGSVGCVKYCLENGCEVDERNCSGVRPLHYAALGGAEAVIKFLQSEGALMNEPADMMSRWLGPTERLESPLILSIKGGFASCVKALLGRGSDPRRVEQGTGMPLEYALKYGSKEVLYVFMNSCYRCFYPTHSQIEEARMKMYDSFHQCRKQGSTMSTEQIMPLLNDSDLVTYFVQAVLSELNTLVRYNSPAFNDFSAYELRRLFEAPAVVDAVTTYIMTHLKALCEKLLDADERTKKKTECMTPERRTLLSPATLDETFRPMVRTAIEERFTKFTRRLKEPVRKKSSDEGTLGTKSAQLLEAVKNGLDHDVARLLNEGVSPNQEVAGQVTALPYAVYYGHRDCVQTLMAAGANWEAPFLYDCTAHKLAAVHNNVEIAELFSARGSSVESTDYSDWHALHWASLFGDKETIRMLVSQGAAIDCRTDDGITPLHLAARGGSQSSVDYLIEQGADMMARQNNGLTLLHCAAEGGLTALVDRCLKKGFVISVSSGDKGWHPIHSAARYGSSNMLSHLLSRKADVQARTSLGMYPVHLAAASGNLKSMRKLVEWGADLTVSSKSNKSVLHLAAVGGSADCVTYCLSHGLTHKLRDSKGWRALHYAADRGSSEVLKFLLAKEVPNAKRFELALKLAIEGDHAECVKLLLDAGGNPMIGILDKESPFECAMKYGSLSVIETLMYYSYNLLCPTDLEVGASRVCIDKTLDTYRSQPTHQKEPPILQKMRFLMQSEAADEIACAVLAFLKTYHTGVSCIAGLSVDETNCLLRMDDAKDIVEHYLVEQLSLLCEKLCTAQVDNAKDDNSDEDNSQDIELARRELFTRESIQKVFGHHIRRGIDEQFARVVPTESYKASSSSDRKGFVVNLDCRIF